MAWSACSLSWAAAIQLFERCAWAFRVSQSFPLRPLTLHATLVPLPRWLRPINVREYESTDLRVQVPGELARRMWRNTNSVRFALTHWTNNLILVLIDQHTKTQPKWMSKHTLTLFIFAVFVVSTLTLSCIRRLFSTRKNCLWNFSDTYTERIL